MHMAVGASRRLHQGGAGLDEPPAAEAIIEQLERILASGDFDGSPRSRAFVRFIVEETLAGREQALTQSAIATRVFGRREDFDPTVDPIVRIQAGRLRRSLERYYLMSGAGDAVRIELPRGSYVPVARWGTEGEVRPSQAGAVQRSADRDGWPSVVVRLFEIDGPVSELDAVASRFEEQVCTEMGRYGDVRVVRERELRSARPRPLRARRLRTVGTPRLRRGGRAGHGPPAGLREREPGLGGGLPRASEPVETSSTKKPQA